MKTAILATLVALTLTPSTFAGDYGTLPGRRRDDGTRMTLVCLGGNPNTVKNAQAAWVEMRTAEMRQDHVTLMRLIFQRKVLALESGTRVDVLLSNEGDPIAKIKIVDGICQGEVGLVLKSDVRLDPPPPVAVVSEPIPLSKEEKEKEAAYEAQHAIEQVRQDRKDRHAQELSALASRIIIAEQRIRIARQFEAQGKTRAAIEFYQAVVRDHGNNPNQPMLKPSLKTAQDRLKLLTK